MKAIKFLFFVTSAFILSSCEDVVQVKLDQGESLLTVDAFVNDMRSQQKIRLTYTDNFFSQKTNEPVRGASVSIKDLTDNKTFIFTDNNDGNYVFNVGINDTIGKVGHNYELNILHQGSTFQSSCLLKRTTKIDTIISKFKEAGAFGGKEGYELGFIGQDPVGDTADFYWIKSFRNGVLFNKGSEINIAYNGAFGDASDGLFFIPPIALGITPSGEVFNKFDVCRVEIHSINLETFNFFNQVFQQTTNSGLFATTPENVRTNIKNISNTKTRAVGWFCMSAVGFKEAIAQ